MLNKSLFFLIPLFIFNCNYSPESNQSGSGGGNGGSAINSSNQSKASGKGSDAGTSCSCENVINCSFDEDCQDVNPCKVGICQNSVCQYTDVSFGTSAHVCGQMINNWPKMQFAYAGYCSFNGIFSIVEEQMCQDVCNPDEFSWPCIAVCGNGVVDFVWEGCDDGNSVNGDGCNSICQIELGWSCTHDMISNCTQN